MTNSGLGLRWKVVPAALRVARVQASATVELSKYQLFECRSGCQRRILCWQEYVEPLESCGLSLLPRVDLQNRSPRSPEFAYPEC
jgi:hypothetical protein